MVRSYIQPQKLATRPKPGNGAFSFSSYFLTTLYPNEISVVILVMFLKLFMECVYYVNSKVTYIYLALSSISI